ncbi:MAG: MaoC family dehydratase [Parahaliea sp.]
MTEVKNGFLSLKPEIYWEQLSPGMRFRTTRRTVTEADLVAFVNLTWLHEELFTLADPDARATMSIPGRVVPGGLVYTFAEGLLGPSLQAGGLAFLHAEMNVHGPTLVGDSIQVHCEVIEHRASSKPGKGMVRTRNQVLNQRGEVVMTYSPLRLMRRQGAM